MSRVFALIVAAPLIIFAGALPPPPQQVQARESTSDILDRLADQAKELPAAPEVADPTFRKAVYPVRVTGDGGVETGGTAVAVRKDALHTAAHISERISRPRWEVFCSGSWRPAFSSPVTGKDLTVLTVSGVTLDTVPVRVPVYGERITVYGLKTKSFAQGMYLGDREPALGLGLVGLDADAKTVDQGDSGGGIFGDDGALLGTISGYLIHSRPVTTMTPIVSDADAKAIAARIPPPARVTCSGGTCYRY